MHPVPPQRHDDHVRDRRSAARHPARAAATDRAGSMRNASTPSTTATTALEIASPVIQYRTARGSTLLRGGRSRTCPSMTVTVVTRRCASVGPRVGFGCHSFGGHSGLCCPPMKRALMISLLVLATFLTAPNGASATSLTWRLTPPAPRAAARAVRGQQKRRVGERRAGHRAANRRRRPHLAAGRAAGHGDARLPRHRGVRRADGRRAVDRRGRGVPGLPDHRRRSHVDGDVPQHRAGRVLQLRGVLRLPPRTGRRRPGRRRVPRAVHFGRRPVVDPPARHRRRSRASTSSRPAASA